MFKCNFKAYEGNEKFIFISYAHKDSDMVYPIIERLNNEGYRVWYDDGITPGSEWPENIADHLDRCETFVFFASPNSVSSDNCKREVNFALSRKKKFFTISLVPTEFSLGLELQISTQQNILFYEYKDIVKFYDTLFLASSLAECKRPEEKSEELIIDQPKPAPVSEVITPAPAQEVVTPTPVSNNTSYEQVTESSSSDSVPTKKKSKKGLIIGLIAAAVLIVLILGIGVLSAVGVTVGVLSSKVKFDEFNEYDKNATSVYFSSDTIDSSYIKKLSRMKKITSISFSDCTFTDDANLSSLKSLSNVDYLYIKDCELADYSFIEKMPNLNSLTISGGSFANVKSLQSEDVTYVDLTNVSDVSLNIFASCYDIYNFELTDCTLVEENIVPLSSNISILKLSGCNLSDSSFLNYSGFNRLYSLDLSNNNLSDVCFIAGSYSSLGKLNLSGNPIDAPSLAVVQNCSEITQLSLSGIPFDDLSIVGQMRELDYLDLSGCGISDLSNGNLQPKELSVLMLQNNNISSLEPLKDLATPADGISHFNISHNPISSFEGLPEQMTYGELIAYDTKITDNPSDAMRYLSTCSINTLAINYIDGIENLNINENLYVIDCPGNLIVNAPADSYLDIILSHTSASFDALLKEKIQNSYYWY